MKTAVSKGCLVVDGVRIDNCNYDPYFIEVGREYLTGYGEEGDRFNLVTVVDVFKGSCAGGYLVTIRDENHVEKTLSCCWLFPTEYFLDEVEETTSKPAGSYLWHVAKVTGFIAMLIIGIGLLLAAAGCTLAP